MNYQEAKEIRYKISHGDLRMDDFIAGESKGYLGGYLEAHAKAQKLVEALEKIQNNNGLWSVNHCKGIAKEVLDQWHKENKEGE